MAKANSNAKTSKITQVNSKSYGKHTRAIRGTYTEITLAEGMKVSSSNQTEANLMAKIIFDAVNTFAPGFKDGRFWSRLVSVFRQQKKLGMDYNYDLAGFEVRLEYPLNKQGKFWLHSEGSKVTLKYYLETKLGCRISMLRIAANETLLTPYPHETMKYEVGISETTRVLQFDFTSLPEGTPVLYVLQCEQLKEGELTGALKGKGVRFF